jgi:2'-5' RNA ligase
MRAFVAIDPSDDARAEVMRILDALRSLAPDAPVTWERADKLHLTLKYLGEVRDVAAVEAALAAVTGTGPLELSLARPGTFGEPRPKVVWLGLGGELARLGALVAAIERAVAPLGHAPEVRPYAPHVTLGRVRDRIASREARALQDAMTRVTPAASPFVAREVVLYESRGGEYLARARFSL